MNSNLSSEDKGQISQIFLAHAKEDIKQVKELYDRLNDKGYKPWLDEKDLLTGQKWREEIPRAIKNSDFIIICLSSTSVAKEGYLQREFKLALNQAVEKAPGTIFLLPVRLDRCQVPDIQLTDYGENLLDYQWVNYYEDDGFERLVNAIELQGSKITDKSKALNFQAETSKKFKNSNTGSEFTNNNEQYSAKIKHLIEEFNYYASNLLNTNFQDGIDNLSGFLDFIKDNKQIKKYIECQKYDCDSDISKIYSSIGNIHAPDADFQEFLPNQNFKIYYIYRYLERGLELYEKNKEEGYIAIACGVSNITKRNPQATIDEFNKRFVKPLLCDRLKIYLNKLITAEPEAIAQYQEEYNESLSRTDQSFQKQSERNLPSAVILTALQLEYKAVRSFLDSLEEKTHPSGTIYEKGIFQSSDRTWEVGIVEIGMGNNNASMEAERAIAYFQPDVVMFVGVAGGIKDVNLGDVVAATKVYGYESGKQAETFQPRPDVGQSSYNLVSRARAEAKKDDWKAYLSSKDSNPNVLVAPIAAGEKVIANKESEIFKFLRKNYGDAVAVEMEGRGLLTATHANQQVSALIVRGISDLIAEKSDSDRAGWQDKAAKNASAFAFQILSLLKIKSSQSPLFQSQETQNIRKYNLENATVYGFAPEAQGNNIISGEQVKIDRVIGNQYNYSAPKKTNKNLSNDNEEIIEIYREKIAAYRKEEAITADPEKKFQLKKLIKECQQKIDELGG